jgi:predicted nucleotidyltransferase
MRALAWRWREPSDPNVQMLDVIAQRLGDDLSSRLVFVGGAVAGLLITDPAQPSIRPTEDVDLLAQVLLKAEYYALEAEPRTRGLQQDMRVGAPICRWTVDDVTVDVMPTLPDVLGFSNRWYPLACATAWTVTLPSGRRIQVITAPAFVATKLEAFAGRGQGDFLFSHDMADIVSVIDGRESLLIELQHAVPELRRHIGTAIAQLLGSRGFLESLPGHLPGDAASQARLPELQAKLEQLAGLQ